MGVLLPGEGRSSLLTGLSVCCRVGWRGEQRRGGAVKNDRSHDQKIQNRQRSLFNISSVTA